MSKSTFITTIDLFEPIVELEDVSIMIDSLSFSVGVIDPDKLLGDIQVSIANESGAIVLQRLLSDMPDFELNELNLDEIELNTKPKLTVDEIKKKIFIKLSKARKIYYQSCLPYDDNKIKLEKLYGMTLDL